MLSSCLASGLPGWPAVNGVCGWYEQILTCIVLCMYTYVQYPPKHVHCGIAELGNDGHHGLEIYIIVHYSERMTATSLAALPSIGCFPGVGDLF